jgi:U3 small nucleolar RNA-associated protein MPP10
VTASLEDIIRSRIIEERFDDVQRKAIVGDIAPKARVELDENKSKKGLGEIYEEEYMQSAGLAVSATPVTDSIKAEVSIYLYPITVLTPKSLCIFLTDGALA